MGFPSLTPNAEKLLQEVLDHQLDNGRCDCTYWLHRFEDLSYAEDIKLRSVFKELSDAEMISAHWADNGIIFMTVLNNGFSYFEIKSMAEEKEKKEKRADKRHDLLLLIIGAVIGAVVGGFVQFLLFKLFGIGG